MPAFQFLLSVWLILLPALPLSSESCAEEDVQELCAESEAKDCCSLGEACACCLAFVLPEAERLNTDASQLQQSKSQYRPPETPLLSYAIWHPPKG